VAALAAATAALSLSAALPTAARAAAGEPRLAVTAAEAAAALTCATKVGPSRPAPVLFVPGTGSDGSQVIAIGKPAFDAMGRSLCSLSLPDRTTGDMQVAVQYVVRAVRSLSREAGRPIAVAGVSQGGVLARIALTYWPSLRPRVTDVVTAAATHHGTTTVNTGVCAVGGCPPAIWQQAAGSRLLAALDARRDETPGRLGWTTVRSTTDELVQPQTGPGATSVLAGATNLVIQRICPGRTTNHLATTVDSVTIAALADAVGHRGPARARRLPADVCDEPYGAGLNQELTQLFLDIAGERFGAGTAEVPRVLAEPPVRAWMRR